MAAFTIFDKDNNGDITKKEMREAVADQLCLGKSAYIITVAHVYKNLSLCAILTSFQGVVALLTAL